MYQRSSPIPLVVRTYVEEVSGLGKRKGGCEFEPGRGLVQIHRARVSERRISLCKTGLESCPPGHGVSMLLYRGLTERT